MSEQLVGTLIGLGGALVGVVAGAAISIWTHRQSQTQEIADNFREVIEKLVDARIAGANIYREYSADIATLEALSAAVNAKRQLYKSTANRMMERASEELTAIDYVTLGYEYEVDAEFEKAEECYLAALTLPEKSTLEKVNMLRNLGRLYLSPTALHNRDRGEQYFRDAIALTNGQADDYSRYLTGFTQEMLSMALLASRYPEWDASSESAQENYEAMSAGNVLRQAAIDSRALRLKQVALGVPVPPSTTPPRSPDVVAAQSPARPRSPGTP
jgi:hypothetical protein